MLSFDQLVQDLQYITEYIKLLRETSFLLDVFMLSYQCTP